MVSANCVIAQAVLLPQVTEEGDGVRISFRTPAASAGARLVWTGRVSPDYPMIEAFPRYIHSLDSMGESANHSFFIKAEQNSGQGAGGALLPLNRIIHARVSAIVRGADGWHPITSDDFTFRVIRDKMGVHRLGLNFEEGPRVLAVSATEVLLQWKLNSPAASEFYYGRDPEKMALQQGGAIGNTATVIVNKLKPGTLYYYRVRCEHPETGDLLQSPLLSFRTTAKDGGEFTFAVMGGSHEDSNQLNPNQAINGINVEVLNQCAASALRGGAEFILFTGNGIAGLTESRAAAEAQYRTWRRALRGVNQFIPIFAAMGQREAAAPWRRSGMGGSMSESPEALFAAIMSNPVDSPTPIAGSPPYSENVFTFAHAGTRFIVLNTEYNSTRGMRPDDDTARTVDRTQRLWLRAQLEQHVKAPWLFVVTHGPAWPSSSAYGNALDHLPGVRDQVWEMIDNFDVDAVFCGQEPNFSHTIVNKTLNTSWTSRVHQFNAGAAGATPEGSPANTPWIDGLAAFHANPHYLLVRIDGGNASIEARTPDGVPFYTVTLKKKRR